MGLDHGAVAPLGSRYTAQSGGAGHDGMGTGNSITIGGIAQGVLLSAVEYALENTDNESSTCVMRPHMQCVSQAIEAFYSDHSSSVHCESGDEHLANSEHIVVNPEVVVRRGHQVKRLCELERTSRITLQDPSQAHERWRQCICNGKANAVP